jgi:N-acetylglucosaminyl-diphospho-decaprenol L-rhamnosyltransferase
LSTTLGATVDILPADLAGLAPTAPTRTESVSVIVVTHQSAGYIRSCLASLRRHPAAVHQEVIVVDNASTDGTAEIVASEFPEARLVVAPGRRGFAANCNHGASVATGQTLFFLNPDARVSDGTIDALLSALDSDDSIGLAGPCLVYPDGSPQPSARRFPTVSATIVRRTPVRWLLRDSRHERRHLMVDLRHEFASSGPVVLRPVDWLLGAAFVVRADMYRSLGAMDESYRLYCEDIDLCWRVWKSGREVVQVTGVAVEHDLGELTRKKFVTRATIWHYRSMFRFVRKNGLRAPCRSRADHEVRSRH